jgi:2-polyprenyl-3-methyl-5-hydroxy-6-metoxy-1,4-benzoquinol methylase
LGKDFTLKILSNGAWEGKENLPHGVDEGLAKGLESFFMQNGIVINNDFEFTKIIDIGCGTGYYVNYLRNSGFDCTGFDGNPFTEEITNGLCKIADFSVPQNLGIFNWVISLEVAEHIPSEFEDVFIDNLHRHNTEGMILSWSIPSFGGDGHVNPKDNEYVINKITNLGYVLDEDSTLILRNSCAEYPKSCWWFGHTLFVFRKVV